MNYAQLIREAWLLTLSQPKLKWFAFIPSFIGVLVFAVQITWQLLMLLEEWDYVSIDLLEVSLLVASFIFSSGLLIWTIFLALVALFFVYILPAWVEGVLIFSTKHLNTDPAQNLFLRQRMVEGFEVFFRIFELRALLGLFSIWSITLTAVALYRYYSDTLFQLLWPVILIYGIFALVVTIFTHFAEHFIVFEGLGVIASLKESVKLVFLNVGSMMAVFLIMVLVNLRVFINVLMVIGVPLAVIWIFAFHSNSFIQVLTIILAIALLGLTSYLTAALDVFSTAVWTKTYLAFKDNQKAMNTSEHANT